MTRDLLLQYICPTTYTKDCSFLGRNGDVICDYCYAKLNEWLDKYDKHVIEQYKANTKIKDTIREIHDNVAQEMYCKGIDDVVIKIKECVGMDWEWDFMFIEQIAEQLKAGVKNE